MPDGRRRSREHWTDSMEAEPANPPAHVHRLPPVIRIAGVGLTIAVALVIVALVLVGLAVYQADQYVKGRGEYRDQENARTNERINRAMCDLLDQLPEGGLLERPRTKYHCGPGIPLEQLTPQEQAQVRGRGAPPPEPAPMRVPPRTGPGPGGPEDPAPRPSPAAASPAAPVPASPTSAPAPSPSLLDPITSPVCNALGICL